MKALFIVFIFLTPPSVYGATFVCHTDKNARPYDTFEVLYSGPGRAFVRYARRPLYDFDDFPSENFPLKRNIPGCYPAPVASHSGAVITIQCRESAGTFTIVGSGGESQALAVFPSGNIGYEAGTVLELSCTRKH